MKNTTALYLIIFHLLCASFVKAQTDFNFRFYPKDDFSQVQTKRDTVGGKFTWKTDTTAGHVRCIVEKNGDDFAIYSTTDLTATLYRSEVRFIQVMKDCTNSIMYQAAGGETIICNPQYGFVQVRFAKNCEDPASVPKGSAPRCETTDQIFGRNLKTLKRK